MNAGRQVRNAPWLFNMEFVLEYVPNELLRNIIRFHPQSSTSASVAVAIPMHAGRYTKFAYVQAPAAGSPVQGSPCSVQQDQGGAVPKYLLERRAMVLPLSSAIYNHCKTTTAAETFCACPEPEGFYKDTTVPH